MTDRERLERLERILICKTCNGTGERQHQIMGSVRCGHCEGTGNRLDALIYRLDNR